MSAKKMSYKQAEAEYERWRKEESDEFSRTAVLFFRKLGIIKPDEKDEDFHLI